MSRRRSVSRSFSGLFLVLATAALAGCGSSQSPAPADRPASDREVELGYTSDSHATSTAAASSIRSSELARDQSMHFVDLLERLPGVSVGPAPGGGYSVRIRGTRSITGNNEPLVVIDGMPVNAMNVMSAMQGIHTGSIDRIDVLRDGGSLAMYGSRGANGVILITMKR
jgi:TonB-dependent starch-binding outer membrane protein SusC